MNIIDLRKKLLQSSTEKRIYTDDRRKVSYRFGSPQWLEYMRNNNIECSVEDRRNLIRREEDRKQPSVETQATDSETTNQRFFLTDGEKKLLQDIYFSDFDDLD